MVKIGNEIRMFLRSEIKHDRDISLQDPMGTDREGKDVLVEDKIADSNYTIDEQVILKIEKKRIRRLVVETLFGREKEVICKRYGLEPYADREMTQREIADDLGISRSYVSRLEKKALAKLQEKERSECFI